jgi:hypothetical protein
MKASEPIALAISPAPSNLVLDQPRAAGEGATVHVVPGYPLPSPRLRGSTSSEGSISSSWQLPHVEVSEQPEARMNQRVTAGIEPDPHV